LDEHPNADDRRRLLERPATLWEDRYLQRPHTAAERLMADRMGESDRMTDEKESAFSIKDLITVAPVFGIVLAALYDWGYFASVDSSLFTLFSWSDHIVFALEALFPAILIVSILGWSLSKFTFAAPLNQQRRTRLWFLVILFGLCMVLSILGKGYLVVVFWVLMGLITLIAIFFRIWLSGIILAYSLGLLFGAYTIGYNNALMALGLPAQQSLFTTSSQMHGRIFRSGERGLLFFDQATRTMSFLLWSEVKRVQSTVTNAPSAP
jgi:hypothetical protein